MQSKALCGQDNESMCTAECISGHKAGMNRINCTWLWK